MVLTKQEKIEKRQAEKEKMKQAAREAQKIRKYEEMQREIKATQLCQPEVDRYWLTAALRVKLPAYRQQIEAMWHAFNHTCDKKAYLMGRLIHLRKIANMQYYRTIGNFCTVTDKIISTFLFDLDKMCKENNVKIAGLLKYNKDENAYYLETHQKSETHLQLLLYTSYNAADSLVWNTRGDNVARKDNETASYFALRDALSTELENNYNWLWEVYKATLRNYLRSTAENQKQLRELRKKERKMADIIVAQAKKLITDERSISHHRLEVQAYESGSKQASFRDKRNRYRDACNRLKSQLKKTIALDEKQIARLVKASDDTSDWLQAAVIKCDKILRLAAQCRRLETQREKVLPYSSKCPLEPIKTQMRMMPDDDPLTFKALSATCGLVRLWERISNAQLSKKALIREKIILKRDNAELVQKIEYDLENGDSKENKCCCVSNTSSKEKLVNRPNALEGTLEVKKFLR